MPQVTGGPVPSDVPPGVPTGVRGSARTYVPSALERDRDRFRRRRAVRSQLVATASTVLVGGLAVLVVTASPGWPRVRETFFSAAVAREAVPLVAQGLWLNVRIFVVGSALVVALGLVVAVARTTRGPVFLPLRLLAASYTDLFRGTPLLLVILLAGFGVPALDLRGLPGDPVVYGTAALVLTYSAYVAEVFRAGIDSVHPSQRAAARSLGLSYAQTLRHVVLPQAVRRVVPPLLNDAASLQKDSGLVSVLGVVEAVRQAQILSSEAFNYTPYVVAAAMFVALTVPMVRLTDTLAARASRRQGIGGAL